MKQYGLQELKQDERDLSLGAIYSLPSLSELPEYYELPSLPVKQQDDSDFCTAYSSCLATEFQEGIETEPSFSFMLSKVISGDAESWGQDLRQGAASQVKFGALEKTLSPFSLQNKSPDFLRKVENWPEISKLLDKAAIHRKRSYIAVTGQYKPFDNIRAAMWKFRNEKRAVVFGTLWDSVWTKDQYIMDNIPEQGTGHAMTVVGFTKRGGKNYLIVQNSLGDTVNKGKHLFSEEIINAMIPRYGAFMFDDLSPESARYYQENGAKKDKGAILTTLLALYKGLLGLYTTLLAKKQAEVGAIPSKWLIPALIWQESGGDDLAVGDLHLVDKAYGCLQCRQPALIDVARATQKYYNAKILLNNRALSLWAFQQYMKIYAEEKRVGKPVTDEIIARIWNGGPNGWQNPATLIYWYGVKNKMRLLEQGKVEPTLLANLLRTT